MPTLRKTSEGLGDDENHLSVTPADTSFSFPTIPPFAVDFNVFDNDGNQTNASSSSISLEESLFVDALLKDTMEQASKTMGAMQEELIRDEIEEITITEEAGDAEVIDPNTNIDHETIKKWRSLIVTDHHGIEHSKHHLVRSFFSPHGLQLARDAHSTDRMMIHMYLYVLLLLLVLAVPTGKSPYTTVHRIVVHIMSTVLLLFPCTHPCNGTTVPVVPAV